jgi:hypothetical protein
MESMWCPQRSRATAPSLSRSVAQGQQTLARRPTMDRESIVTAPRSVPACHARPLSQVASPAAAPTQCHEASGSVKGLRSRSLRSRRSDERRKKPRRP